MSQQQIQDLQPMGSVSVSGIDGAPSDIHQTLNQAADAKGARAYHARVFLPCAWRYPSAPRESVASA